MNKLLIKNGIVVDPASGTETKRNIFVEDGVIKDYKRFNAAGSNKNLREINAEGLHVFPGFIDMHVHLREPGFEYKENIKSGMEAAVSGGLTSICCMPNTDPPNDSMSVNRYLISRGREIDLVNLFPIGAISRGLKGESLSNIGELKESGAVAISDDGSPVTNSSLMSRAMLYAKTFGLPVISHSEDLKLRGKGVINEGLVSQKLGVAGIPFIAEDIAVARDIMLAKYYGAKLHIAHVSTAGSVNIVRQAKKDGVDVTCETCPHYFTLTEESLLNYNTNAKMNPPLRTFNDLKAIKEGLFDGTIDVIASDHAPHSADEKDTTLESAPFGIIGLQTIVPLTLALHENNKFSLLDVSRVLSANPAAILGLNGRGGLRDGFKGDITIIDINKEWKFTEKRIKSLSKNSPFLGMNLRGIPVYTIVGGRILKAN